MPPKWPGTVPKVECDRNAPSRLENTGAEDQVMKLTAEAPTRHVQIRSADSSSAGFPAGITGLDRYILTRDRSPSLDEDNSSSFYFEKIDGVGAPSQAGHLPHEAQPGVTGEAKQATGVASIDDDDYHLNTDGDMPLTLRKQRVLNPKIRLFGVPKAIAGQRGSGSLADTGIAAASRDRQPPTSQFLAPGRAATPPSPALHPVPQRSPHSAKLAKDGRQDLRAVKTSNVRNKEEDGGDDYVEENIEDHEYNDVHMADEGHVDAALGEEQDYTGQASVEFMDGIDQAAVKQTPAQLVPTPLAFSNFFPSLTPGTTRNYDDQVEHFDRDDEPSDAVPEGERMPPTWQPSSFRDHFDKPTGAMFHRFIIERYSKCESIAKFEGCWYALSCPGCGANCNAEGYYMQSVKTTLHHIREAHPEWRARADPQTEREFFELMAHEGTAFSREEMWKVEQGILTWPMEKRKIGDVHAKVFYGNPRGPVGSPGMVGPPGVAGALVVAGSSGTVTRPIEPKSSYSAASIPSSNAPKLKAGGTGAAQVKSRLPSCLARLQQPSRPILPHLRMRINQLCLRQSRSPARALRGPSSSRAIHRHLLVFLVTKRTQKQARCLLGVPSDEI